MNEQQVDKELINNANKSSEKDTKAKPGDKSTKRISLQVTSSMHKKFKEIALEQEETMNSLIVFVLKRYLKEMEDLKIKNEKLRQRLKR